MRKLCNTLYLTTRDAYLALDGENVTVLVDGEVVARRPLHNIEGIVTFNYTGASPALVGACMQKNIAISYIGLNGRFLGRVTGPEHGSILTRKAQYRISDDCEKSAQIARNMVAGKIFNCRGLIDRARRDHALRVDAEKLKRASVYLKNAASRVVAAEELDSVRGCEGEAANVYFSVFNELILADGEAFRFKGRSRRPPLDRVNALLSFCYALLAHECGAALYAAGLDPYAGLLHRDRPGRMSLALDLMEELRPALADRFVLTVINKGIVKPEGFVVEESGAVVMTDETRETVIRKWQERKQEELTHPFLKEKIQWGLVPYAQALLLSRHIRGDIAQYPPFFWK
jgi:CRISPR-associated protein Cas1